MTASPPRALLFSGQGAQKVGMGADLFELSPSAHALYELADTKLGWPLTDYSFRGPEEILTETRVCQPALYAHGLAILAAFEDHTGRPLGFEAAAGLSLGEYTAHAAAGSFTFQTGLALVAERGRLMQEACNTTVGTMITLLGATAEQAREIAASKVPVAIGVSCNAATFARDARILADAGFTLTEVQPIDQFLWSPHVELVGVFRR